MKLLKLMGLIGWAILLGIYSLLFLILSLIVRPLSNLMKKLGELRKKDNQWDPLLLHNILLTLLIMVIYIIYLPFFLLWVTLKFLASKREKPTTH